MIPYHSFINQTDVKTELIDLPHGLVDGPFHNLEVLSMSFEQQTVSRWLAMASVKPKRSMVKEVNATASAGSCLICGRPANSSRGLCVSHYLKFVRTMHDLPKTRRATFEQQQIEAGRILASGAIREIKVPNPFHSEDCEE